jgi:opacity protein-like surface antigen
MRFKLFGFALLVVCLHFAAIPAFSQVVPAYQAHGLNLSIGIGPSSYDVDWGHGRMLGGTIWGDWYPVYPSRVPTFFKGFGLEGELRDISLDPNLPPQKNQRQDTAGGGLIYAWRINNRFHPYFKGLVMDGSVDFYPAGCCYSHDTRTVIAPGGGFEYRFYGPLWVRGDYEYQDWVGYLLGNTLNPQGFTLGIAYDFSHPMKH